jgi:hypothetical protein
MPDVCAFNHSATSPDVRQGVRNLYVWTSGNARRVRLQPLGHLTLANHPIRPLGEGADYTHRTATDKPSMETDSEGSYLGAAETQGTPHVTVQ